MFEGMHKIEIKPGRIFFHVWYLFESKENLQEFEMIWSESKYLNILVFALGLVTNAWVHNYSILYELNKNVFDITM